MVRTLIKKYHLEDMVCLNPLKAGQWFGHIPGENIHECLKGLNPLKAGQWFGRNFEGLYRMAQIMSQSPQGGAMVRTL